MLIIKKYFITKNIYKKILFHNIKNKKVNLSKNIFVLLKKISFSQEFSIKSYFYLLNIMLSSGHKTAIWKIIIIYNVFTKKTKIIIKCIKFNLHCSFLHVSGNLSTCHRYHQHFFNEFWKCCKNKKIFFSR